LLGILLGCLGLLRLQFFTHFTLISREHLIDFVDVDTGLGEQGLEPFSEIAPELRNLRTLRKSDLVYILPLPFPDRPASRP